jgi:hypothetical protein
MIFIFINLFYLEITSNYITLIYSAKKIIVWWGSWMLCRAFCYNKRLFLRGGLIGWHRLEKRKLEGAVQGGRW